MISVTGFAAFIAVSVLLTPLAQAQLVLDVPQCIQDCVDQSPDTNCGLANIGCICRASSGNFLPGVVTCMHSKCEGNLDTGILITPLQLACLVAGSPIPASAIQSAENAASSLATQASTTATQGGSSNEGAGVTTTVYAPSPSVSTVTATATRSGSTYYEIYPVTIGSTTTLTGPTSTLTSLSTSSPTNGGFTGVIPVVIVATDSKGSTYTSTTTQPGAISSYTTTDSRGSTVTRQSTFIESTTASGNSDSSSTSLSSSTGSSQSTSTSSTLATSATTNSNEALSSQTSTAANPDSTNSAPFKNTNGAGALATGNSLGLIILLAVLCMWL